jgi:hypothetical protein
MNVKSFLLTLLHRNSIICCLVKEMRKPNKILLSKVFLIRTEVSEACKRNERVSLKVRSSKMNLTEIRFIRQVVIK